MLCACFGLIAIMTFFDVLAWIEGKPQDVLGILLAPIFNPVIIFIDLVMGYYVWTRIRHTKKTINQLKWR